MSARLISAVARENTIAIGNLHISKTKTNTKLFLFVQNILQKLIWTPFSLLPRTSPRNLVRLLGDYRQTSFEWKDGLTEWKGNGGLLFATNHETVIGMLRLDYKRTYTELSSFVVDPDFRGQGIGDTMLAHVIQNSKNPIWLQVQQDNPAQRLYQRNGFRKWKVSNGRYLLCHNVGSIESSYFRDQMK
jgi:ribosomal protein S18 acetylase RimI-like enzyme